MSIFEICGIVTYAWQYEYIYIYILQTNTTGGSNDYYK